MKPNPQVLLVDRHSSDVKVVRDTLGSAGLEIHVRTSASAALVAFHALEPDLVIVDSDVPGTSGAAVTREIKNTERGRSTPVILMAEGPIPETQRSETLTASGCSMLLQKPLMPQDLLDTLSRFLPNAFIGTKDPAAPKPKSSAPRRAAGVMRDPGTPFTADSFDEDSLRALLDQVFPTSDSGGLAQAIRTRPTPAGHDAGADAPAAARAGTPEPGHATAPASDAARADAAPVDTRASTPSPIAQTPARTRAGASARESKSSSKSRATPKGRAPEPPPIEPQAPVAATELSASDLVAEYLATGDTAREDEIPTGLSVKEDAALDRVFDGSWSRPTEADERDIEPLDDAPTTTPAAHAELTASAAPATSEPPSTSAPTSPAEPAAATPAGSDSFFDASFGDLEEEAPKSGAAVWQELDAALPPAAPSVTTPATTAPHTTAPYATAPYATAPYATAPHATSIEPVTPSFATPAQASAPETVTTPAASMAASTDASTASTTAPTEPSQAAPTTLATPATPTTSREPEQPETIPLAREASPAADTARSQGSGSRRSKKNKKAKNRGQESPESIPLAKDEPSATPGTLHTQSVAESLTSASRESTVSRSMAVEPDEPMRHALQASARPRRTGTVAVVAVGIALAAAVAVFFVMNRPGDSDLRPADPGRARTPQSHASIKNEDTAAPEADSLERESLPPLIPSADAQEPAQDLGSGPSAPVTHGASPATSPTSARPAPESARGASPPATPESARPAPRPGTSTAPSKAPPGPASSAADATPPETRAVAPAPTTAAPPPSAAPTAAAPPPSPSSSPDPGPEHPRAPVQEAPAQAAPAAGASDTSATLPRAIPADPGASDPAPEPPSPIGQVALGATMPAPTAPAAAGGESAREEVEPLASPVPLSRPAPVYPPSALAMRSTGTVGLLVKVETDGRVTDVKVVRAASPTLNAAAVAAARRWTYKPAHRGIQSVATWIEETVVFRLK